VKKLTILAALGALLVALAAAPAFLVDTGGS
jgi:hypothetical protein